MTTPDNPGTTPRRRPRPLARRSALLSGLVLLVSSALVLAAVSWYVARPPVARRPVARRPVARAASLPRAGVVVAARVPAEALQALGDVWYYDYTLAEDLPGVPRAFLVRPHYDEERVRALLRERPGSWWLVGNEPNDPYQDDLSPGAYAAFYRRFVTLARRIDPTCRVVAGGVANADWAWAEAFRQAYRAEYGALPDPDGWHVHVYVLEPERDQLDVAEFQLRVERFRYWMAQVGAADLPLFLTEFGALFGLYDGHLGRPAEDPECVAAYLHETVAWLEATDHVQHYAWFATGTGGEFNGDLFEPSGARTPLGEAYRRAIRQYPEVEDER